MLNTSILPSQDDEDLLGGLMRKKPYPVGGARPTSVPDAISSSVMPPPSSSGSGTTISKPNERVESAPMPRISSEISAPLPSAAPVSLAPIGPKISPQMQQGQDQVTSAQQHLDDANANATKHHSIGRKILEGIGTFLAPGLMEALPGTILNSYFERNQARQGLDDATGGLNRLQAGEHQQAETENLMHPQHQVNTPFELALQQDPKLTPEKWFATEQANKPEAQVSSPQAGYAMAIADAIRRGVDPASDPHVMAWKSAIENTAKEKDPNRDDKAIAIYAKDPKTLTPEEKNYIHGYEQYIAKSKTEPGIARINVLGGFGMEVADPSNPGQTMIVPRNQATGYAGKGSASVTVPKKEAEYMTSGKGGQQLTAFNTAIVHLDTLERLAGDLNNSNTQIFNRASQEWAKQTGQAAPSNFQAAVNAMSGEVASALKASGATDQEISHVMETFSNAQSPQQLKGAINTYRELLKGKRDQLRSQHSAAQGGQPNFGDQAQPQGKWNPQTGRYE